VTRALRLGVTFPAYREIDAVNWSNLKAMAASPMHYFHRVHHPEPDTPRLAFGRAVHTAVFEPDRFPLEYVVFDGARRQGKAWDEFAEQHSDKTILKATEYQTCLDVRDAVFHHPAARRLIERGESEVTMLWKDADTGIDCKGRMDHLVNREIIVDLKTTTSVGAFEFEQRSARMLYHSQMAFYQRGLGTGVNPRLVAVEIEPPHDVAVFALTDDALLIGHQQVDDLLKRVVSCRKSGEWLGRSLEEQDLTVPGWMLPDDDYTMGGLFGGFGDNPDALDAG
jgi:exodeoxyribonuclease VIII